MNPRLPSLELADSEVGLPQLTRYGISTSGYPNRLISAGSSGADPLSITSLIALGT
jgi:hypothetical protein